MIRNVLILSVIILAAVPVIQAESPVLLPADRSRLRELLRGYRRAEHNSDQRAQLTDEILVIGDGMFAAQQLLENIRGSLSMPLNRYATALNTAARAAVSDQSQTFARSTLNNLRRDVGNLHRQGETLTAESILEVAEPAIRKLKKAYLTDADRLIAESESLSRQRSQIMEFAGDWNRCMEILGTPDAGLQQWLGLFEYLVVSRSGLPSTVARTMARNETELLSIDPLEAIAIRDVNIMRALVGLNALQFDVKLSNAARGHSRDMKKHGFFSHTSVVPGKETLVDRGRQAGVAVHGENIFMGNTDPYAANHALFLSPGHHLNIFRNAFAKIGIGRSDVYWTQKFAR